MFTPPPSPNPPRTSFGPDSELPPLPKATMEESVQTSSPEDVKRRMGRRFRWAVLSVPLIVIVFSAYCGYTTGRVTQESSRPPLPISWHGLISEGSRWRQHKRHPEPEPQAPQASSLGQATTLSQVITLSSLFIPATPTTSGSAASSSRTSVSNQTVPKIPSAPPTLPTPFPQPFDGSIAQNFSSLSCSDFFANMTDSAPFRSCRPFSLLLQSSTEFINAQTNLTLMNSIIWGTCDTTIDYSQCQANMGWFASQLQTACTNELNNLDTMAVNTLVALNAFSVMHDVGCEPDPTSNTYCYLNAVFNTNPSDSYYYQLPLGIPLPSSSQPTCSACSKSVMSIYATALENSVTGPLLTGLKATYEASALFAVQNCGAGFAQTNLVSSALSISSSPSWMLAGSLIILALMSLTQIS